MITIEAPDSTKPLVLAESGAIVEYLVDHFGSACPSLVPQRYTPGKEGKVGGETEEWMRYRYFMHYAEGSLMPFLVMTLVNDCELLLSSGTKKIKEIDVYSYPQCPTILCQTHYHYCRIAG